MSHFSVEDYQRLQKEVDRLKSQLDRIDGALKELLRTLKEDYNCKTLEEARDLLAALYSEEDKIRTLLEVEEVKFKKMWSEVLDED